MSKATHTITTPNTDAKLIALCAEFDRLERAWWNLHDGPDLIEDDDVRQSALAPLKARQDEIAPTIWQTPARTLAGIRAKAKAWVTFSPEILDGDGSWDEKFRASIVLDLIDAGPVT